MCRERLNGNIGQFEQINTSSYYYIKRACAKSCVPPKIHPILLAKKETEVELLLHFCFGMKALRTSIFRNTVLQVTCTNGNCSGIEKAVYLARRPAIRFQLEIDRLMGAGWRLIWIGGYLSNGYHTVVVR